MTARGTASGEFSAPQLRAEVTASDLKFANGQTIDSMVASITGGAAATAPLAVSVRVTGHRAPNPDASLASATLIARGVTSDHTLELNGTTLSKQPVRASSKRRLARGYVAELCMAWFAGRRRKRQAARAALIGTGADNDRTRIGERSGRRASTRAAPSFPRLKFS